MNRDHSIPVVLWACAAFVLHAGLGGGFAGVNHVSEKHEKERAEVRQMVRSVGREFAAIDVEFSGPLDVAEFIDRAEDCDGLDVDYNKDATCCTITLEGFNGDITVTADSLTYRFRNAETPKEMALQLESANALLLGMSEMQAALPL